MNERIKELAEQAGEYAMSLLGTETYPEGFAAGIHFTELLIKDMIIVVRKHQDISYSTERAIKKHFGVD